LDCRRLPAGSPSERGCPMTHPCNCGLPCNPGRCGAEGERRKGDALALLSAHRETVIRRAQRALLTVVLETGSATADDIRARVELPTGIGPKCFGAAPGPLARAGVIRADGFTKTCRPVGHARPVTIWALAARAAALRWLAVHPDLPDPGDDDQADKPDVGRQRLLFPFATNEPTPTVAAVGAGMEA